MPTLAKKSLPIFDKCNAKRCVCGPKIFSSVTIKGQRKHLQAIVYNPESFQAHKALLSKGFPKIHASVTTEGFSEGIIF